MDFWKSNVHWDSLVFVFVSSRLVTQGLNKTKWPTLMSFCKSMDTLFLSDILINCSRCWRWGVIGIDWEGLPGQLLRWIITLPGTVLYETKIRVCFTEERLFGFGSARRLIWGFYCCWEHLPLMCSYGLKHCLKMIWGGASATCWFGKCFSQALFIC